MAVMACLGSVGIRGSLDPNNSSSAAMAATEALAATVDEVWRRRAAPLVIVAPVAVLW